MTDNDHALRLGPSAVGAYWQRFWFRRESMYTLGLVRMAFGALAMLWTLWLLPILHDMLGPDGVAPNPDDPPIPGHWGVFEIWTSYPALYIGWAVLFLAAIALTVGWHSRVAAILVFVLVLSFQHRDTWVFNAGDAVVRIEALFIALSPCGTALSLDQRRKTGSFWSAQTRPIWPLRLMQVQVSIIYLSSVLIKLSGDAWTQGTAVSYALRLVDMQRLPSPDWITTNALIMNLATWSALAIEAAVGVLVWNKRLRPWVLAAGVLMHLMIDVGILIGIFSYAMFVLYVAWVSPETAKRLPDNIKRVVTKLRSRLRRKPSEPTTDSPSVESPKRRPEEQDSPSIVFNGAEAVSEHQRRRTDIDGPRVQARSPARAENGDLVSAVPTANGSGSSRVSIPDRK